VIDRQWLAACEFMCTTSKEEARPERSGSKATTRYSEPNFSGIYWERIFRNPIISYEYHISEFPKKKWHNSWTLVVLDRTKKMQHLAPMQQKKSHSISSSDIEHERVPYI
jgi:hypothetical protein